MTQLVENHFYLSLLSSLSLWMTYAPCLGDDLVDAFKFLMDDFFMVNIDLSSKCSS
jgi:hypothetical protein